MSSPCSSRPVSSVTVTRSPRFTNSGSSWKAGVGVSGGRLRRIVGRGRGSALQGQVSGGDAALQQRVFRQGVSARAARVAARRDRVGVRGVPGRVSVSGRVLRAGEGLGEGLGRAGVKYVRNLVFRPRLAVESWAAAAKKRRHSSGGRACMVLVAGRRRPAIVYRNGIQVTKRFFPWMPGSVLVVLLWNVRHAVRRYRARGDGRTPNGITILCR